MNTIASYKKENFSRKETDKEDLQTRDASIKHKPTGMIVEFTGRKKVEEK